MSHTTPTGSEVATRASQEQGYDDLSSKMWKTRGARLAAYTRLRRQAWWSNFSISLLSVYSIALSIAPLYTDLKSALPDGLGFVSVMISVFVIVLAQAEGSKNHMFIAEMMHKCALQLGRLFNEYVIELRSGSLTAERKLQFYNKYAEILESAQFNFTATPKSIHPPATDRLTLGVSEEPAARTSAVAAMYPAKIM